MTAKHRPVITPPLAPAIREFMSIWDELHADCSSGESQCLVNDFMQETGIRLPSPEEKDSDNE